MAFNLVDASYDAQAQRAYVLLRDTDEDGEEMVVSLTFSFHAAAVQADPKGNRAQGRQDSAAGSVEPLGRDRPRPGQERAGSLGST